jgi:predicted nucleic acid-binding protein
MPIPYLDTNIILRYLTKDDPDKAARAKTLIDQIAAGDLEVTTSEIVISEVVFVLSSKALYNVPRELIRDYLTALLSMKGLRLQYKRTYARALELYAAVLRLDFADALSVAHMERQKLTTILSFDTDFDNLPNITRQEP